MNKIALGVLFIMILPKLSLAEQLITDYGVHGHLFDIEEISMQEEILAKLEIAKGNGQLAKLQADFADKVRKKVTNPTRVAGVGKASQSRKWTYDPSYIVPEDIIDHRGAIIAAAGSKVNPLDRLKWGEKLIFIDGEDKEQIAWIREQKGKVTLIAGAPLEIADTLKRPVFFDQAGLLSKKFGLKCVPAIIEQQGKVLVIREVRI